MLGRLLALLGALSGARGVSFLRKAPKVSVPVDVVHDWTAAIHADDFDNVLPQLKPMPPLPQVPGCYVLAARGCPNRQDAAISKGWVRDWRGEAKFGASSNRTACEELRKQSWSRFCGTDDLEVRMIVKAPATPKEPGCYVWAPSGCEKRKWFTASVWTHDRFGELKMFAGRNRTICERWRLHQWRQYCGVVDLHVLFVANESRQPQQLLARRPPSIPTQPGCYVWAPLGCPRWPAFGLPSSIAWQHDLHGEMHLNASIVKSTCMVSRAKSYLELCGGTGVKMAFVARPDTPAESARDARAMRAMVEWDTYMASEELHQPASSTGGVQALARLRNSTTGASGNATPSSSLPTGPGCYVWASQGCPQKPAALVVQGWMRDVAAEEKFGARTNQTSCQGRKAPWMAWCGAKDVELRWVADKVAPKEAPKAPQAPTDPGCYVWAPSGCPRRGWFDGTNWTHDVFGEGSMFAAWNRTICERWRLMQWQQFCGAYDVQMHFVPGTDVDVMRRQAPKAPRQAGCYIWMPEGCPRKPHFGLNASLAWLRDPLGEISGENGTLGMNESAKKEVCEVTRARSYSRWCGGFSAEMLYVEPSNASNDTEVEAHHKEEDKPIRKGQQFLGVEANTQDDEAGTDAETTGKSNAGGGSVEEVEIDDDGQAVTHASIGDKSEANDNAPPAPTEPGCYIYAPEGCTKRPWFKTKTWVHDVFGESSLNVATDRQQCEVTRRQQFRRYCGNDSILTRFIPGARST